MVANCGCELWTPTAPCIFAGCPYIPSIYSLGSFAGCPYIPLLPQTKVSKFIDDWLWETNKLPQIQDLIRIYLMQTTTRVFISATSADLAGYRKVVKEALLANDVHPVEQTDFPPDFRTVSDLIAQKIGTCDAVICLVGFVFGAEPFDRPPDRLRRSYTQMEFDAARRLGKPVYLFLAGEDCAFDSRPSEHPEKLQLQLAIERRFSAAVCAGKSFRHPSGCGNALRISNSTLIRNGHEHGRTCPIHLLDLCSRAVSSS